MRTRAARFNIIFMLALLASSLLGGCRSASPEEKSDVEATTLRFHLRANAHPLSRTMSAVVGRTGHFELIVEENPFLSEIYVVEAALVEELGGGYSLKLKFDRQGTWLLEQLTTANKGRHVAIYSEFGVSRWLAAPLLTKRIDNGEFVFTPDATRLETERIVRGLKNVASEVKKENN